MISTGARSKSRRGGVLQRSPYPSAAFKGGLILKGEQEKNKKEKRRKRKREEKGRGKSEILWLFTEMTLLFLLTFPLQKFVGVTGL